MRNRNIIRNAGLLAIALLTSALAAPISMSLTGLDRPVTVTSRDLQISSGGSFNAQVGNPTLVTPFSTTFWCVDVENFISAGQPTATFDANIVLVSNTTAQASFVQKGTVNSWEDGNNYSAQQRYNAAAYLIEMIQSGGSGFTNLDIQQAIWRLTDAADSADQTTGSWENAAYINAINFGLNATTQHTWATVSGVAGANGVLSESDRRQTFLVEVASSPVPEPGTYALMGGGLLILAGLRRRRNAN